MRVYLRVNYGRVFQDASAVLQDLLQKVFAYSPGITVIEIAAGIATLQTFMHPDDIDGALEAYRSHLEEGAPFDVE